MQQLRLVRTTDEALVVSPVDHAVGDGPTPQYVLLVDDRIRTAVARVPGRRRETGRPRTTPAMSPRELQARIRGGQTVADVVEVSGLPPEKVTRYAAPVLDERAHVAETVRRLATPHASGSDRRSLGDVVAERLAGEADGGSGRWDAWLEQDGTWTVQVAWEREGRPLAARWAWHPAHRALRPRDGIAEDVARPLPTGEFGVPVRPLRPVHPSGGGLPTVEQVPPRTSTSAAGRPAPDATRTPGADAGRAADDAARSAGSTSTASTPTSSTPTAPAAEARPVARAEDARADAGPGADLRPGPDAGPGSAARDVSGAADAAPRPAPAATAARPAAPSPAREEPPAVEEVELPHEERRAVGDGRPAPRPRPGATRRAGGRASVPSWDDILFGARQQP